MGSEMCIRDSDGTARVGLYLLLYATTSDIPFVSSGAWGAGCFLCGLLCRVMPMVRWPLWFAMPCYAMVGWKSLISGDFPSDQGAGPEQQGIIWDNDAAGYTLAETRHIRVKCGAGQSAACV